MTILRSKWNGLNRQKPPNKYSLKKIDSLNGEVKARIALCKRAGGAPVISNELVKRNDKSVHIIQRVRCVGGVCECGCRRPANQYNGSLEPHETPRRRSQGAKVSLRQSIMVLRECHQRLDRRKVKLQWIPKEE